MTWDAIVFDMDGLLVDTEVVWELAERRLIESFGNEYDLAIRDEFIGLRLDEFFAGLMRHYEFGGLSVEAVSERLVDDVCALLEQGLNPQPGANEILTTTRSHGYPCAIASSSPMRIIDTVVDAMGWRDIFDHLCTADDVPKGKPAPDVYLLAANTLGVAPNKCLALEDSPNGARAAVAAGMTCYAVPDLSHSSTDNFDGITSHVFSSLNQIIPLITS